MAAVAQARVTELLVQQYITFRYGHDHFKCFFEHSEPPEGFCTNLHRQFSCDKYLPKTKSDSR